MQVLQKLRIGLGRYRRSGMPQYLQLRHALNDLIESGQFAPGSPLPAERELARATNWSRVTVRRALAELAADGIVQSRVGSGNFVGGQRIQRSFSQLTSFTEDLRARGLNPRVEFLDRGIGPATSEEAIALAISPQSLVVRLLRLRFGGERPLAVESTVVPQTILPSPELVAGSLYEALKKLGHLPERALQRLHAVALDSVTAALLKKPVGSPALQLDRHAYLSDGRAVELTRSIYVADAYDFVAELRRTE